MKALVIMHCAGEGPGTLGDWLREQGVELQVARLFDGDRLPDPAGLSAVVSLGGPMNVYEEGEYPFLQQEAAFLRQVVAEGMPTIGICLGAQMIARSLGARVEKSPAPEIGWGRVELTADGLREPLLAGLDPALDVLQWHEDMFQVPAGARPLARSSVCPNQAFRVGNALGLQFHLEIDRRMIADWFREREDLEAVIDGYGKLEPSLRRESRKLYNNFLELIASK